MKNDDLLESERSYIEVQMRRDPMFRLAIRWYMLLWDLRYYLYQWPLDKPVWNCDDAQNPVLVRARSKQKLDPDDPRYEEEIF